MFLTKAHIPRRTFLRGVGVTLALPLLDAMLPAQTPLSRTAANSKPRFGFIYVPHGATMQMWTPTSEGAGFEFSPILSPLEPYRNRVNVLSGLAHMMAGSQPGENGGDHSRSAAVFLSGVHPKKTAGQDILGGKTIDQVIAQKIGQDTALPSLELGIEDVGYTGVCGQGYSCVYSNTISWESSTKPLPMEINPQVIFERLFGDGSNPAQRTARKQQDRSILDSLTHDLARLGTTLGPDDRNKLDEYLDDIREIERRLQMAEKNASTDVAIPDNLVGVPESFDVHIKLMFDLLALAFKADITRVSTLMFARDLSGRSYPDSGVRGGFHGSSHHGEDPTRMEQYAKINKYHVQMLAYFLEKLKSTPDGDGSLLDHSLIVYGSSMANGNLHNHLPLPVVMAGGAGHFQGGRHLRYKEGTPMSNLFLSILDGTGIPLDSFGDSTARLEV